MDGKIDGEISADAAGPPRPSVGDDFQEEICAELNTSAVQPSTCGELSRFFEQELRTDMDARADGTRSGDAGATALGATDAVQVLGGAGSRPAADSGYTTPCGAAADSSPVSAHDHTCSCHDERPFGIFLLPLPLPPLLLLPAFFDVCFVLSSAF